TLLFTLEVIGVGFILNILAWLGLRVRGLATRIAVTASVSEGLFLLYFVHVSGGSRSPLWSLVFVLIAATSLRHGYPCGSLTALVFSVATFIYAGFSINPSNPDLDNVYQAFVRALAFLVMSLMVGWVLNYEQRESMRETAQTQEVLQRTESDIKAFTVLSDT